MLHQMLDEKDDEILKLSKRREMLEKEVGRCRLVIGQQREKMKTLHKTIQESKVKRRNQEEELDEPQEQASQPSRGLPHCSPAATQATIPTGDTSKVALGLLPPKVDDQGQPRHW